MTRIALVSMAILLFALGCARPGLPHAAIMLAPARLPAPPIAPVARPAPLARAAASSPGAASTPPPATANAPPATPTATPSPAPSRTTMPSPTPSPTSAPTPTAMPTPTATPPPTATPVPTATLEPTAAWATSTPAPTTAPRPTADPRYAFVARYAPQSEVLLESVPQLAQQRALSCEAASARMVLAARGVLPSEEEILARMGLSDDPHQGFRGNVDGNGHRPGLPDYGAYAEVVARVLESYGVPATAARGMSDEALRAAVRGGRAVIVWLTAQDHPQIVEEDGFRLVEGEHAYVVVGLLADGRLLVHDPWRARPNSGRTGTFPVRAVQQWDLFDRMAVVVPLS